MRIYTRTGDRGTTGLIGGARVDKDDLRIWSLGEVDELNATIGLCRIHSSGTPLDSELERLQSRLFDLGAEIATPVGSPYFQESVGPAHVAELEASIDRMTAELPPLRNFILPGGTPLAAHLHLARTVCRRAERSIVAFAKSTEIRAEVETFINRLSDWLFTAARYANRIAGVEDIPWTRGDAQPAPVEEPA